MCICVYVYLDLQSIITVCLINETAQMRQHTRTEIIRSLMKNSCLDVSLSPPKKVCEKKIPPKHPGTFTSTGTAARSHVELRSVGSRTQKTAQLQSSARPSSGERPKPEKQYQPTPSANNSEGLQIKKNAEN